MQRALQWIGLHKANEFLAGQSRPIPSFSSDATHVDRDCPVSNETPVGFVAMVKTLVGLWSEPIFSTFHGTKYNELAEADVS